MTRTDLLNHLATKYGLKTYLEIGTQDKAQNFNHIVCPQKLCVDPDQKADADCIMTSDKFFELYEGGDKWDLIFIDGLHHADQVEKDLINAQKVLSSKGYIILHDTNPQYEQHTIVPRQTPRGHWHGDVYRLAARLQNKVTIDIDCGCTVCTIHTTVSDVQVDWKYFDKNRKELLNLIEWQDFIKLYEP